MEKSIDARTDSFTGRFENSLVTIVQYDHDHPVAKLELDTEELQMLWSIVDFLCRSLNLERKS